MTISYTDADISTGKQRVALIEDFATQVYDDPDDARAFLENIQRMAVSPIRTPLELAEQSKEGFTHVANYLKIKCG